MAILTGKNKDMIWVKTLYFVHPKSTLHRIWPSKLTFEPRHDLGKALLFCPSKIYSALYVHLDFRTNFNMSTCT